MFIFIILDFIFKHELILFIRSVGRAFFFSEDIPLIINIINIPYAIEFFTLFSYFILTYIFVKGYNNIYIQTNKNFDLLMQYSPKIKVAILNEDKEVISVSDVGTIKKAKGYLTGGIIYNISSNNLKIDYYTPNNNTFGIIVFVFICATIIIFITLIIKNIVKRRKSIMYPRN